MSNLNADRRLKPTSCTTGKEAKKSESAKMSIKSVIIKSSGKTSGVYAAIRRILVSQLRCRHVVSVHHTGASEGGPAEGGPTENEPGPAVGPKDGPRCGLQCCHLVLAE